MKNYKEKKSKLSFLLICIFILFLFSSFFIQTCTTDTPPSILTLVTEDVDGDGYIDRLVVTFDENVADATIVAGNFSVSVGSISEVVDDGVSDDAIIWVNLLDEAQLTDVVPQLTINAGGIEDLAGNPNALVSNYASTDGAGPAILSAIASDETNVIVGIDNDDTVTVTFSENTNQPVINAVNINGVLALSGGHSWLDGAGVITSVTWSSADVLVVTLSDTTSDPTVAVGDTITLDGVTIIDGTNNSSTVAFSEIAGTIYIAGYTRNSSNVDVPCYWKNGSRTDLSVLDASKDGRSESIYPSGADIYVAGYTAKTSPSVFVPCYWKNGTRTPLSVLDSDQNGYAESILVSGNDIYVAGYTKNNSGVDVPCYWENRTRTDFPVLENTQAHSVYISGTDIYVTGESFSTSFVFVPRYWKNGLLVNDLPVIDTSKSGFANSIYIAETDIYISGNTSNSTDVYVPCYWKNESRTDLSVLDDTKHGYAQSIYVSGTDIYIAGYTTKTSPSVFVPCYWKNGSRTDLPVLGDTKDGYAQSIYVLNSIICVAGYTKDSSDVIVPCYWKNGLRTDLSVLDATKNGCAESIYFYGF